MFPGLLSGFLHKSRFLQLKYRRDDWCLEDFSHLNVNEMKDFNLQLAFSCPKTQPHGVQKTKYHH